MKYLLATILLTLSMSASADAEKALRHKVICVEGYKFLVSWSDTGTWRPPSVVRMYKKGNGAIRPPQPIECEE